MQLVTDSGLRGRGGAGFGTGQKWSFLPKDVFPRYLAVNGDEGEPSTFKDHMLLEGDPHQLIEGIVISSYAIQAHHAFVYLRGEFALGAERLGQALDEAYARGFVGKNIKGSGFDLEIVLHRGAGCYIAGDETGLLSSLEGERAMPRIKPPFPAVQGVYAAPTIVNNVETLSAVPHIVRNGAEWYAAMRRQPLERHARLLGVGHGRAPRQLRSRARDHVPRPHRRPGRWRRGRQEARVLHPRRRVVAVAPRGASRRRRSTWTTCRASSTRRRCSDRAR